MVCLARSNRIINDVPKPPDDVRQVIDAVRNSCWHIVSDLVETESGKHYADICAGTLDLGQARPVRERPASDWKRWKPTRLPKGEPARPRPTIRVRGKTYRLYWGDLHCHGTFSGDAEGEIDEVFQRLEAALKA